MKMTKKLLVLMMSTIMAGSILTGCGNKETVKSDTQVETPADEQDNKQAEQEAASNSQQQENSEENLEQDTEQDEVVEDVQGEVDPTAAQELFYVITDGLELPASFKVPEDMFSEIYGIDTSILESYYVSMPEMNVDATEIAIFEVKDQTQTETVKAAIEKRQKDLLQQWESYLPAQYDLVKAYKVEVKDNRVLFVISSNADKIVEKFKTA